MPYMQLRVTPHQFNLPFEEALTVIPHLILKRDLTDKEMYITADEKLEKHGEETHRHFHFNFYTEDKKDTLQDNIRKFYREKDVVCKGNKCYSLQEIDEPTDIKRWLRYCMKEKWIPRLTVLPYSQEEIKNMEILAKDERSRAIDYNKQKRSKLLDKQTYSDKIFKHLDTLKLTEFKDINIAITKFYVKDKKPVCIRTIDGYTNNYMLQAKLISFEDFYTRNHSIY